MAATGLVFLLSQISVFGLNEATEARSIAVFNRATAAFYPAPDDTESAVVLLDDESIAGIDTYPPGLAIHAMFLRAILDLGPKALFVDFNFIDDRDDEGFDDLAATLRAYRARNVEVYLPVNGDATIPIIPGLQALAEEGVVTLTSPSVYRDRFGAVTYRLKSEADGLPTIAYSYLLDHRPGLAARLPEEREFQVVWPLPPSPLNCRPYRTAPCYPPANPAQEVLAAIDLQWGESDPGAPGPYRIQQQYIPYLYARGVVDGAVRDVAEAVIKGKFVVYGSDFRMVADRFPTPFYSINSRVSDVPGPFVHAMAVENLIDLNGTPPLVVDKNRTDIQVVRWLVVLVVTALSAALIWKYRFGAVLAPFVAVLAMIAYALCYHWFFRVAPGTWMGDMLGLWAGQVALVGRVHSAFSWAGERLGRRLGWSRKSSRAGGAG